MVTFAHAAGVPLEELVPVVLSTGGAVLLVVRLFISRLRTRRHPG